MDTKEIDEYVKKIYNNCTKETCYSRVVKKWSSDNRFWGHCAVVALLINDKFGGKIKKCRIKEDNISHFFNEIDGQVFDYTRSQYSYPINIIEIKDVDRNKLLKVKSTYNRYLKLKSKGI